MGMDFWYDSKHRDQEVWVTVVSNVWLRQRGNILTIYCMKAYQQHLYQVSKCKSRHYRSVLFVLSCLYGEIAWNIIKTCFSYWRSHFFSLRWKYLRFKLYKGLLQLRKGPQSDRSMLSLCRRCAWRSHPDFHIYFFWKMWGINRHYFLFWKCRKHPSPTMPFGKIETQIKVEVLLGKNPL